MLCLHWITHFVPFYQCLVLPFTFNPLQAIGQVYWQLKSIWGGCSKMTKGRNLAMGLELDMCEVEEMGRSEWVKISFTSEQAAQSCQTALRKKKKKTLCFIYSALYPWQPERSGKLGPYFTLLWGLGFHRGSQMCGRWAKAARAPRQRSTHEPRAGTLAAGGVMGILWEHWPCGGWGRGRRLFFQHKKAAVFSYLLAIVCYCFC